MSLISDVLRELPQLRAEAESLMLDTFVAFSADDPDVVNGIEVDSWLAEYGTPGKVQGPSTQTRDTNARVVTVGGVERPVVEGGLHIPLSAELPLIGWQFECTAVGASSDPSLVGRRWQVVDVPAKSFATARRLDVVEIPQEA